MLECLRNREARKKIFPLNRQARNLFHSRCMTCCSVSHFRGIITGIYNIFCCFIQISFPIQLQNNFESASKESVWMIKVQPVTMMPCGNSNCQTIAVSEAVTIAPHWSAAQATQLHNSHNYMQVAGPEKNCAL